MIFKKETFLGTALAQNILAILLLIVVAIKVPVLFVLIFLAVLVLFQKKLKEYGKKNPGLNIYDASRELAQNDMMSFLQTKIIFASLVIIGGVIIIKILGLAPETEKSGTKAVPKIEDFLETVKEVKPQQPPAAAATAEIKKILPSGEVEILKESKGNDNFGSIK